MSDKPLQQQLQQRTSDLPPVRGSVGSALQPAWRCIPGFPRSASRSSATSEGITAPPLCPELVVPESHECTLLLPVDATRPWVPDVTKFVVVDMNESPVLRFAFLSSTQRQGGYEAPPGPGSAPRLVLTSAEGSTVLAQCSTRPGRPGAGPYFVYSRVGELFATLDRDAGSSGRGSAGGGGESRFLLSDRGGGRLRYVVPAELATGAVQVTNEHGMLRGETRSHEGGDLTARIGPGSDVGAMLCGLLCSLQLRVAEAHGDGAP